MTLSTNEKSQEPCFSCKHALKIDIYCFFLNYYNFVEIEARHEVERQMKFAKHRHCLQRWYRAWGNIAGVGNGARAPITGPLPGRPLGVALCNSLFRASRVGHYCKREESRSARIAPSSALSTLRLASSQLAAPHPRDSLHKFHLVSLLQVKAHLSTFILMH